MRVPDGPPDDRFVYLSDVLPTAWQGVNYADVPEGGTLLVLGAGPIGDMASRIAMHRGIRVIVVDRIPERLERVARRGAETLDLDAIDDVAERVRELTGGRGADSVLEAVGMEAHGSPVAEAVQKSLRLLPMKLQQLMMTNMSVERLSALYLAFEAVRRGGTVSISGVYGGSSDPMPMMQLFDKQLQLRMGQANVRAWTGELLTLLEQDEDHLGVEGFATHRLPLDAAPEAYASFQAKDDGMVKVLFRP